MCTCARHSQPLRRRQLNVTCVLQKWRPIKTKIYWIEIGTTKWLIWSSTNRNSILPFSWNALASLLSLYSFLPLHWSGPSWGDDQWPYLDGCQQFLFFRANMDFRLDPLEGIEKLKNYLWSWWYAKSAASTSISEYPLMQSNWFYVLAWQFIRPFSTNLQPIDAIDSSRNWRNERIDTQNAK